MLIAFDLHPRMICVRYETFAVSADVSTMEAVLRMVEPSTARRGHPGDGSRIDVRENLQAQPGGSAAIFWCSPPRAAR